MAEIVAEFFGVIGVDIVAPATLSEFLPWFLTVFIGILLVVTVFRVIGGIVHAILAFRR